MDLANLRESYTKGSLHRLDLKECPIAQFELWFEQARTAKLHEPNAMILATVDAAGMSSQRTVLLKGLDARGFVFYTNYESRKAVELEATSKCSLLFPWIELERQVIIQGLVERVSREETTTYFITRPRESQIGAWASDQSREISSREELEEKTRDLEQRFADQDVPVPDHWGGYRVRPLAIEFWQGGVGRLHDRLRYERPELTAAWLIKRYAP